MNNNEERALFLEILAVDLMAHGYNAAAATDLCKCAQALRNAQNARERALREAAQICIDEFPNSEELDVSRVLARKILALLNQAEPAKAITIADVNAVNAALHHVEPEKPWLAEQISSAKASLDTHPDYLRSTKANSEAAQAAANIGVGNFIEIREFRNGEVFCVRRIPESKANSEVETPSENEADMDGLLLNALLNARNHLLKYGVASSNTEKVLLGAMCAVEELKRLRNAALQSAKAEGEE